MTDIKQGKLPNQSKPTWTEPVITVIDLACARHGNQYPADDGAANRS